MAKIMLGAHTVKSHGAKVAREHLHDWLILMALGLIDLALNLVEPFHRYIGPDMLTDLTFPFHPDTIPMWAVPILCVLVPVTVFTIYYYFRRDVYDLHHAILGLGFSCLATAVTTDSIKDAVGRPRPNFFYRCFPDGKSKFDPITRDVVCHGIHRIIKEGYKSFPSGHTSWSFAGLTFLAWYLSGKVKAFDRRGHVAKLCLVFLPILIATLVGITRVDDYWHHWTDVFAGAFIGSVIAAFCYLQFFPYPYDDNGWAPHAYFRMLAEKSGRATTMPRSISRAELDDDVEAVDPTSPHDHHRRRDSTDSEF
ncbi:PREDICTED: probable lipid phosphate phosphatase 4 [Tarenaya hassleriana]|uniref:probable lipid phosphate phosphatase 4 n=1 Tax=Tarenaya hassleriana TaxID=28532 RepID=UPI00053C23BA|nr:PREDICTED: probable lipid phosphate phosphatase 4 [Tarenaya hassleriana]